MPASGDPFEKRKPGIIWSRQRKEPHLWFVFHGKFTTNDAEAGIEAWRGEFIALEGKSALLVWDCRKMEGYEAAARSKWMVTLKELKPQIIQIWLISHSSFIRMGASFMGMVTWLKTNAANSEEEIPGH